MTLRGEAAVVGIAELPIQEFYPGRSQVGLAAQVSGLAIADAGLRKEDIDGLVISNALAPSDLAEYIGIRPCYATAVGMQGASGATGVTLAAAALKAGLCNYVLVVIAQHRWPATGRGGGGGQQATIGSEFESPFGLGAGAGTGYAMIYQRHMYEFGTKPEQLARIAVNQRFNAMTNPNSVFGNLHGAAHPIALGGKTITVEDVLNSRYIEAPLRLLESVMPCAGGVACIVTTAARAKALPHRPAYLLGSGIEQGAGTLWQSPRITTTPVKVSAAHAFAMAGYSPKDMQFAEFYD